MARQEKQTHEKVRNGHNAMTRFMTLADNKTKEIHVDDIILTPAYKDGLPAEVSQHEKDTEKMLRWVMKQLNIVGVPAVAFTDAEVDAIDPEIRTREVD